MNTIGDLPGMQRASRSEIVDRVFDVVVIGGGITGAATARDAALRGLSVLLVEKDDFASGTSSRSSKLIHGGLRYLQTYQFRMVAESLRERERMLRIAPHLTRVRPFLYLLYQGYPESKALLNLGLTYYDVASGAWRRRRHRMLDAAQVLALEPHLAAERLIGAGLYHDVLTDDARVTLDTVHGAADAGARVMNHARVVDLLREAGRITGVRIRDELTGETFDAVGRQVLNATGPWTDTVRAMETGSGASRLRPTKGVHIVVRKTDFPLDTAVFLRSPRDGRVVWPTPSLEEDLVYIGTTDTDYTGPLDDVVPTQEDVEYLIEVANVAIPAARLDLSHVVGSWAGLRPLVAPAPGVSADRTSREHEISTGPGGMLTISGGKLTTSRLMAKQFVDAAAHALRPRRGAGPSVRSTTTQVPIAGGELATARRVVTALRDSDVPEHLARRWLHRYGSNAGGVLEVWRRELRNREPLGPRDLTRAEVIYAVESEAARTLADLLVRRTSAFFWDAEGGLPPDAAVADELASLLGWSRAERDRQVDDYRVLVARHRFGR